MKALYPTVVDQKPVFFINSFHTTFNVLTFSDCPYGKLSFFNDCFKHSLTKGELPSHLNAVLSLR